MTSIADLPIGTRVRVVEGRGGPGFRGLTGTVKRHTKSGSVIVKFDRPPSKRIRVTDDPHGGPWNVASLEVLGEDSTLLVDSSGEHSADHWLYVPRVDAWTVIGDIKDAVEVAQEFESASPALFFKGFDEGAAAIIAKFGLREDAAARTVDIDTEPVPANALEIRASLATDTARDYAGRANSRKLRPEHQADLKAASLGLEFDVVSFRKAVTAALSLATTRAGQSPARREYAKEARHLIHWSDSVIDNVLRGLPPVEPGARSPKIREQEERIAALEIALAEEKAGRLTAIERAGVFADDAEQASIRATKLEGQVKVAERLLVDQTTVLADVASFRKAAEDDRDTVATVLDYAIGLLENRDQGRVFGYWDGIIAE